MKSKLEFLTILCMAIICTDSMQTYAQGPCPILGTGNICYPGTTGLTTTGGYSTGGESWISTDMLIATVGYTAGTGACTIYGVAVGTTTIKYTDGLGNSCDFPMAIEGTVSPVVRGLHRVCVSAITDLTANPTGGTWSSVSTATATVDPTLGVVLGVAAGNTTIHYNYTNSCGTFTTNYTMTVNPLPNAGTIANTSVCVTSTTTLTATGGDAGGNWSGSNNSIATIDGGTGEVFPVSAGSVTMTYTASNSCGSTFSTATVTVDPPLVTPAISGGTPGICSGASTSLSANPPGGTWSTSDITVATVTSAGVVTGRQPGTVAITYTYTNTCGSFPATRTMTVNPLPNPGIINGQPAVCAGSTISMTDATTGGLWSSSDNGIATVDLTGVVTGAAAGAVTISYTVFNGFGCAASATYAVTVDVPASVSAITGAAPVCVGGTVALSDATPAGSWSSSDNTLATVDGSGTVNGAGAGSPVIAYTVINACGTYSVTATMTVNPLPAPGTLSGTLEICHTGNTLLTASGSSGGTWSSDNTALATVDGSGNVYGAGASGGTVTISYTLTTAAGCMASATQAVTVDAAPDAGSITSAAGLCITNTYGLTSSGDAGGTWSSSNTAVVTISGEGMVTLATGNSTIHYTVTNTCGTASASYIVTVDAFYDITGAGYVCVGAAITLADATAAGTWSSSNTAIATVDAGGSVSSVGAGIATITYTATNFCGTLSAYHYVTVAAIPVITGTYQVCPSIVVDGMAEAFSSPISADLDDGHGGWSTSDATVATTYGVAFMGGEPGTATITYTSLYGCAASVVVTVSPRPFTGTISVPGSITVLSSGSFSSMAPDLGSYFWWWEPSVTLYTSSATSPTMSFTAGTTGNSYAIFIVTESNGCWNASADFHFTVTP